MPGRRPDRRQWNLLALSMGASVVVYALAAGITATRALPAPEHEASSGLRLLLLAAAGILLLGALALAPRVPPGATAATLPDPAVFYRRGIAAMALGEAVALCGLVLFLTARRPGDLLLLAALSLAAIGTVAARGRAYWDARERPEDPSAPLSPE